eukprot:EG_transcript_29948
MGCSNQVYGDHNTCSGTANVLVGFHCNAVGMGNVIRAPQLPALACVAPALSPPPPYPVSPPQPLSPPSGVSFPDKRPPQLATSDETACIICLANARAVCIVDCGHAQFCHPCLWRCVHEGSGRCPTCNGPITQVINVFL